MYTTQQTIINLIQNAIFLSALSCDCISQFMHEWERITSKRTKEKNDVYSYDFKLIKINCVAKGRTYFENKKSAKKKPNKQNKPNTFDKNEKQICMLGNESAASVYGTFASKWFRRRTQKHRPHSIIPCEKHFNAVCGIEYLALKSIKKKKKKMRRAHTYIDCNKTQYVTCVHQNKNKK